MSEFVSGDVVRLKSGGPKMTVISVGEHHIDCAWFIPEAFQFSNVETVNLHLPNRNGEDETGQPCVSSFPVTAVENVD